VTSAPRAVKVSISTAVWIVLRSIRPRIGAMKEAHTHVETSGNTSTLQGLFFGILIEMCANHLKKDKIGMHTRFRRFMRPGISF